MKRLKCNVGEYGVIVNKQGEFLILRLPLNKEFTKEMWMFPGGRLEADDQPELGLQREVLEENWSKNQSYCPGSRCQMGHRESVKVLGFFSMSSD